MGKRFLQNRNDMEKENMFYLFDMVRKKPLTYNPVTGSYTITASVSRLKVWDYQYESNLLYMQQLAERFNYMEVRTMPASTLAKLLNA